ncbi:MAG: radical SAM protein [Algisphaera sp.]
MPLSIATHTDDVLKHTTSLCPVCRVLVPAVVVDRDGCVFMQKTCPDHGAFEVLINSNRQWYFDSVGADGGCCGGDSGGCCSPGSGSDSAPDKSGGTVEHGATCIALIEMVEDCNLTCPTCYAGSAPPLPGHDLSVVSLHDFKQRIETVVARKGPLDILQLSGGEPTLHPDFFELLHWALGHEHIGYVLLNTNGLRIAQEPDFAQRLGDAHTQHGHFEIYLQFDGVQEAGQVALRGLDLRKMRERVIDCCGQWNVPVTLAMTVNRAALPHLGEAVLFGLERPIVRGVVFQPEFGSGRTSGEVGVTVKGKAPTPERTTDSSHLNVADVIHAVVNQTHGTVTEADFTPLPCGDPNCHTIGYLIRHDDAPNGVLRVSDFVDFKQLQGFLADRVNFDLDDLKHCGCETQELGAVLQELEIGPRNVFRLFIKPFMDAWTYDQHRVDRCCVHVIKENGELDSFCRHYAMKG